MPQIFSESNTLRIQNPSTKTTLTFAETTNRVITYPDITDTLVSKNTTDIFTNKTATGATNTLTAKLLKSATTEISISAATAPTTGQVLTATSGTTATWQTPSGGGGSSETITAAGALSTTIDSIINTSAGPLTLTLANGTTDQLKTVRLLYRNGSTALITCVKGSFLLTPSEPIRHLRYTSNGWAIEDPDNDCFFPTVLFGSKITVSSYTYGAFCSLSADGLTAVVSSYGYDNLYVYTRTTGAWSQQTILSYSSITFPSLPNRADGSAQSYSNFISSGGGYLHLGYYISLSADGNTLVASADGYFHIIYYQLINQLWQDNFNIYGDTGNPDLENNYQYTDNYWNVYGGAVVFTRSGGTWTFQALLEQPYVLVGPATDTNFPTIDGAQADTVNSIFYTNSLSADGNTVAIGCPGSNTNGRVIIFTRSSTTWSVQGSRLTGSGPTFGQDVSLSANGNILAVGAFGYTTTGRTVIFNRVGTTWSSVANLDPTGNVGNTHVGISVCLSADGNTLAVGGYLDNTSVGATWIYTQTDGIWSQQGSKLVGLPSHKYQGRCVFLSANGKVLVVGGNHNSNLNNPYNDWEIFVFIRSGNKWIQQGNSITGVGNINPKSLCLSANGNAMIVSGSDSATSSDGIPGSFWTFV